MYNSKAIDATIMDFQDKRIRELLRENHALEYQLEEKGYGISQAIANFKRLFEEKNARIRELEAMKLSQPSTAYVEGLKARLSKTEFDLKGNVRIWTAANDKLRQEVKQLREFNEDLQASRLDLLQRNDKLQKQLASYEPDDESDLDYGEAELYYEDTLDEDDESNCLNDY